MNTEIVRCDMMPLFVALILLCIFLNLMNNLTTNCLKVVKTWYTPVNFVQFIENNDPFTNSTFCNYFHCQVIHNVINTHAEFGSPP